MVHFVLPKGQKNSRAAFNDLAMSMKDLPQADFSEEGYAHFTRPLTASQITAFETAGFIRADIHCYQILPAPQTDWERLWLLRALRQKPSTTVENPENWSGTHMYFLALLDEAEKTEIRNRGFTATLMPSRYLHTIS